MSSPYDIALEAAEVKPRAIVLEKKHCFAAIVFASLCKGRDRMLLVIEVIVLAMCESVFAAQCQQICGHKAHKIRSPRTGRAAGEFWKHEIAGFAVACRTFRTGADSSALLWMPRQHDAAKIQM